MEVGKSKLSANELRIDFRKNKLDMRKRLEWDIEKGKLCGKWGGM